MAALKKRIRGRLLDLCKSGIKTKQQAETTKAQWKKRGWKYVTVTKEYDGYAVYGL